MQYNTIRDDEGNVAAYLYNKSNKETPKPTAPEPKLIKQYESRTDAQKQKDNEASQAMANYKARINKNEQLKKQMEQKTKAMLDGSENPVETAKQLADSQKAIKSVYSDIKMQANAHENLLDVVKGLKKETLGQAELNLFKKAIAKSPLIEYTETDAGEPAIMDINGKIAKIEDLDEGFLVNMLHVVKDRPWTLSLGLGATFLPWGKVDKIPGMNKVKKYGLQLAGFSGASSVGAAIDEKMRASRIDARKKDNVIYKSLMEAAVSNDTVEEAFGTISATVTFNADKDVMAHTNELQQRMQTIGSATNMMHAAKQEFIDSVAGTLILDGIIQGVSKGAKASAPYIKTGAQAVAKQLPSASAGVTTGGITTAGLTAIGVPMPVSIVGGGLVGTITRNKIKQGQDFVASGLNKVKSIGEEQLKNKGVNEILDNARNQVNTVLNKKNSDPAYSIDGYLKQYYGEIANNPSALTSLNNKLGSLGISLNLNNTTDKALAVMLMSPNSPQFIKTMVNDSPAAGVAIRDMLTAFSVAFDNQIKNMLPVNNKQMSVATFASDLKTMQTNNIAALNELAKYGNKLTNNKTVLNVSANEYRDAIRGYADGKQLVNSGLPSKLSNRKKNITAHKEENQNLFTRFATLNDTEAKIVSEKGLLRGANFEDLVTMRANLAVIDDDAILAAPSIANLRIAIDQGLEEVLSNVSDSTSRDALRNQMQQVVNKIHAFEKLGNNKLLNAIMKENNPDVILKHFTDMMQEVQILDNASAIKQVMSILPIQKRAQLETLIINKIIEDATDNLTTPGKLVINSAKLRGFINKVEAQFATSEGKALLSILKDYAEVFGDTAALMKAATTKSTKTGPSGGIGHNLFNKFRVYMAGKLFRNLIGYLGPGHSSSTFRLANILAKRLRDPLDPNIAKAVDNLYNARLVAYKNAKTPEAAATAKADLQAIKEANNLASEVNAMSQKITANSTMIQDMEASLKQQNIDDAQVENIIGEQLGIPTKAVVETSDIQMVPISDMKNLVNLNINKLLQMEPELVKAMENDLYKRITSEAIEIAENLAANNKQFNIKDFINTIIYRYNQVLPNNMQKYSLQEIAEQDLKPIVDNTIAAREEARKAYEIEKAAAYEAEQAEQIAKQEAEAIANQEKEAAEEAARQQRAQAEAEAAAKREAENMEAKKAAEIEKEKKAELAKEKAKEKRNAKKQAAKEMEEKLARIEEKAANEAEKQVARDAEIEKLQEEGAKLAEQVTKETNDKIAKGEIESEFKQNLGVKFGFIKDGKTFKQSVSIDKMTSWKERDKLTMLANAEYFAKNLDINSVAENAKKALNDKAIPADEKAAVREFIRDLDAVLPEDKYSKIITLISDAPTGKKKQASINPDDYYEIRKLKSALQARPYIDKSPQAFTRRSKIIYDAIKAARTYDNKEVYFSYAVWLNSMLSSLDTSWHLNGDLFARLALGNTKDAKTINKSIAAYRNDPKALQAHIRKDEHGYGFISSETEEAVTKLLTTKLPDNQPFELGMVYNILKKANPLEKVYIKRNIPDMIINDAKNKGIDFKHFLKDKDGNPVIIYRGVDPEKEARDIFGEMSEEAVYQLQERALDLAKPYSFNNSGLKPRSVNFTDSEFLYRNSVFTSRDITHALHFASNDIRGVGNFFLRKDANLINASLSKAELGHSNKYAKELYNIPYYEAIHKNNNEKLREQLLKSDGVILSDDTVVLFNTNAAVWPGAYVEEDMAKKLTSPVFYSHGGAVGAIAGIEQNEDGSYGFNVERALMGIAIGYGLHQTAPKLQAAATNLMKDDKFTSLIKTMLLLPNDKNTPSSALMKAALEPTKIMKEQLVKTNIKFMVGGPNALTKPNKLEKAKKLKQQGADDLDIFRDTGYYYNKGQDKWKFEFDKDANWIDPTHIEKLLKSMPASGIMLLKLKDVIPNAKKLFNFYPSLENITIKTGVNKRDLGLNDAVAKFVYNDLVPPKILIDINTLKNPNTASLQHEVQHAIQRIEGYIDLEDGLLPTKDTILKYIKALDTNEGYNDVIDILAFEANKHYDDKLTGEKLAEAIYKHVPIETIHYYLSLVEQEARYVQDAITMRRLGLSEFLPIEFNGAAQSVMK